LACLATFDAQNPIFILGLVPLHSTTADKLRLYVTERKRLYYDGLSEAFFVSMEGTHLCYSAVRKTFVSLTYVVGIQNDSANARPCIHGLRHTFTISRMLEWYRCGSPVNDLLPNLSISMGHMKPACTLENDGRLEHAQQMAGHESPRTTKLYDRTKDEITLSEVERIRL
jgi:integrase